MDFLISILIKSIVLVGSRGVYLHKWKAMPSQETFLSSTNMHPRDGNASYTTWSAHSNSSNKREEFQLMLSGYCFMLVL